MNDILKIALEFGFLALLGLAYYWYQRRKIINNDKLEIFHGLQELVEDLKKAQEVKTKFQTEFSSLIENIETYNNENNYSELSHLFSNPPHFLSEELKNAFEYFKKQVDFHK